MSPFDFFSVALSIILGLGVTRLLSSVEALFERRDSVTFAAEPMVWAFLLFGWQLQYWWAIFELKPLSEWTLVLFLSLVGLALCLFVASALILPGRLLGEDQVDLGEHLRRAVGRRSPC